MIIVLQITYNLPLTKYTNMKKLIAVLLITFLGAGFSYAQEKPKAERPEIEKSKPLFPKHWGKPPEIQLRDYVDLPGKFGKGSSTLANWIKENIASDKESGKFPDKDKDFALSDAEKSDPKKFERDMLSAVKSGKISKQDAAKKLDALRDEMAKKGEFKRPKRMAKPELSSEVKDQISAVKEMEKNLHSQIRAKVDELGKDASKEQIKIAVEAFKESNKDKFEEIKTAHDAIRKDLEAARPSKPERPELSAELKAKVEILKEKRKEMEVAQKELHKNLKDASEVERKAMIASFKESNKDKHQEIKTQAKEVKEDIRALVESEATRTSDL